MRCCCDTYEPNLRLFPGLERVIMLFLNLGDVRFGSLFARDPKSFSTEGKDFEQAAIEAAQATIVKGPTTLKPGDDGLPPLENVSISDD